MTPLLVFTIDVALWLAVTGSWIAIVTVLFK
jgi:hypothetical protein